MRSEILGTVCCLLTISVGPVHAASTAGSDSDITNAFPGLNKISAAHAGVMIYYAPALTERLTGSAAENKEDEEIVGIADRPIRTRLLGAGRDYFVVECNRGLSDDPNCAFLQQLPSGELSRVSFKWARLNATGGGVSGLRFILPGNGIIYVDGHTNSNFNERRKFVWKDGMFVEVEQPFLYVGLDSTTINAITLYEDKDFRTPLAQLPSGSKVAVLLNVPRTDDYLVKTPFGLVGWARIESAKAEKTIKGLYFNGD